MTDGSRPIVGGTIRRCSDSRLGAHALRATAATNALGHEADIGQGARMAGPHLTSSPRAFTTPATRAEDSPTV